MGGSRFPFLQLHDCKAVGTNVQAGMWRSVEGPGARKCDGAAGIARHASGGTARTRASEFQNSKVRVEGRASELQNSLGVCGGEGGIVQCEHGSRGRAHFGDDGPALHASRGISGTLRKTGVWNIDVPT